MAIFVGRTYIGFNVTPEVETPLVTQGPFRLGEWLVEPRPNRLIANLYILAKPFIVRDQILPKV